MDRKKKIYENGAKQRKSLLLFIDNSVPTPAEGCSTENKIS